MEPVEGDPAGGLMVARGQAFCYLAILHKVLAPGRRMPFEPFKRRELMAAAWPLAACAAALSQPGLSGRVTRHRRLPLSGRRRLTLSSAHYRMSASQVRHHRGRHRARHSSGDAARIMPTVMIALSDPIVSLAQTRAMM